MPPGSDGRVQDSGRGFGGVSMTVSAAEQLVSDLGLFPRGTADDQAAVPDEVTLVPPT
jgi:hypothetical protein